MSRILELLGGALVAALVWHFVTGYGSQWEVGRYGMPRPLVAADGRYLDGTKIDDVTLALVRAGKHEEVFLAGLCVCGLFLAWYVFNVVQIIRLQRRGEKLNVIMAMVREKQDKGQWQEANQLLDRYDQLARQTYGKHWKPKCR